MHQHFPERGADRIYIALFSFIYRQTHMQQLCINKYTVLILAFSCIQCKMALYFRIYSIAAHEISLTLHRVLRTVSVIIDYLVIIRHTLVHLFVFMIEHPGSSMKHHRY